MKSIREQLQELSGHELPIRTIASLCGLDSATLWRAINGTSKRVDLAVIESLASKGFIKLSGSVKKSEVEELRQGILEAKRAVEKLRNEIFWYKEEQA